MTPRTFLIILLLMTKVSRPAGAQTNAGSTMTKAQVIAAGEKLADDQLAAFESHPPGIGWVAGVMWAGYADFTHYSNKPAYLEALKTMGGKAVWTPFRSEKSPHFADDLAICQSFLEIYAETKDPAVLAPTQSRIDAASDYITSQQQPGKLTWWWCDALFMGAPVQARLFALTNEHRYLAALDTEWGRTADLLYDKEEHLFFRDKSYLKKMTKNGGKVFWSRGNGWVFAGLAKFLPDVPADDPARTRYVTVFKEMAAKLASLQQADGTWRPSLLDPEQFPDSETSGTALDCYAFAWGINNGLLDAKTYLPVATKAWAALLAARMHNGLLGFVQGVAGEPGLVKAGNTTIYATGPFLMAAGQLSLLAPLTLPPLPILATEPPPPPTPIPTPRPSAMPAPSPTATASQPPTPTP